MKGRRYTISVISHTLLLLFTSLFIGSSSLSELPPLDLVCPPETGQALKTVRLQGISGTLELGGPTINFLDYSCFSSDLPLAEGEHEFEVVTFTPSVAGRYTFFLGADFSGNFSLYQGSFNVDNPCSLLMRSAEKSYVPPLPAVLPLPEAYLSFDLRANETYSLLISNELAGGVGAWEVMAYHETAGTLSGFDDPVLHPLLFDLLLTDTSEVYFATPQQWIVDESGNLDTMATLSTFFANDEAQLDAFLVQLMATGMPVVTSDCGPMVVRLNDELGQSAACEGLTLIRTFAVQTVDENCSPAMTSCQQVISFRRPTLADVQWPAYSAKVLCDAGFSTDGDTGGPEDNPSVAATGRPLLLTAAGYVDLDSSYQNLSVSYVDEPRIVVCEGSYKYRRQWSLEDECDQESSFTLPQLVAVADEVGPAFVNFQDTIRISTSPFSCIANFAVPIPAVMDGNGCSSTVLTTYTILAFGESFFAGGDIDDTDVIQIEIGEHILILCAEDDCGNETCEETVLIVADDTPPTASCNDNVSILIGGGDVLNGIQGIDRVFPSEVNDGSYDNCGEVTLELRRNYWRNNTCDPSANRWSPWGGHIDFYCCDIGEDVTIELRVTDEGGLQSVCWIVVETADLLLPYCYAPEGRSFSCEETPAAFPEDIEAAYANDFRATSILMNSLFGGGSGTDNCAVDTIVEMQPLFQLNECGWGTITRRFEAWQLRPEGDANGNWAIDINEVFRSTNNCVQLITVEETHHFVIDFPQDAVLDCGAVDLPGVVTTTMGCDALAINTGDPLSLLPTGEECYQLSITYDVINWCVWDGSSEGWEIPRLTEDDGELFGTGFGVEAAERPVLRITSAVGPDDENCDGILSTTENGTDDATDIRYFLLLDRNHPDADGDSSLPDAEYDNVAETPADCVPVDGDGVRTYGRFRYTQLVKVLNNLSIDIEVTDFGGPTIYCPDLAHGQFGDEDGDCEEEVSISFSVTEACGVFDNVSLAVNILAAQLDAFAVDTDGDGTISPEEFSAEAGPDGDVLSNITLVSDGTYTFTGIFPIITAAMGDSIYHAVKVLLEDGCGNQIEKVITFDVIDCALTTPICNGGLSVFLVEQGDGTCSLTIEAIEFIASPIFDCNGQGPAVDSTGLPIITSYGVYLATEVEADPDFHPQLDAIQTFITLTEDSEVVTVVYVYAFDEEGNYNYCETYVLILPYCHAPPAVALSCEEMPADFPADIEGAYANDFGATSLLMNSLFGEATSTENCAVDTIVEMQPLLQLNDCGWGTITRRFEAWQLRPFGDTNGNGEIDIEEVVRSTNSCTQVITVQETHHFVIDFPQDAVLDCGAVDLPGVVTTTMGCDVLAINTGDPLSLVPTGDECYQLSITYDVINWCVWDGSSEGWEIPRLTEDDGELFGTGFGVEAAERPVLRITSAVGPDDENCDGILGADENGTDDAADIRYFLLLDRNHPDADGDSSLPDVEYDNVAETPAGCIPGDGDGARTYGRFRYTQLVKVLSVDSISINVSAFGGPTVNCPGLLPGQFGDDDGDCEEAVSIAFSLGVVCGLFAEELNTNVSIVSAQLDAFAVDANGDNTIQPNEFIAETGEAGNVISNITNNNDGTYTFTGTYPVITAAMGNNIYHALAILVEDLCGNQNSEVITFDVIDCKAPAPICNNGVTYILAPLGDGTCGVTIQASELVASPIFDCNGQGPAVDSQTGLPIVTTYAIYPASEVEADPDFQPDATHTSITVTEDGEATTVVYLYAFDEEGNYDYCETSLTLEISGECTLDLAGVILTKDDETIEGVEVYLSGSANLVDETGADGYYHFGGLDFGGSFSLVPYLNTDPANGVNTIDMILLLKHINGTAPLQNPFLLIAADVDGSGDITMADFDVLRQLLLGNIQAFPNNTSWRFVVADFVFPNPLDPWATPFPEIVSLINVQEDMIDIDFVGVKIGDLNGTAMSNVQSPTESYLRETVYLEVEDIALEKGNTYTIPISANDLVELDGLQGTFQWQDLEILDIQFDRPSDFNTQHLGFCYLADGYLTMAWHKPVDQHTVPAVQRRASTPLFSLLVRAHQDGNLRDLLRINSRYTAAEAYKQGETASLGIKFYLGNPQRISLPVLYQNTPNPFAATTVIGFNLPDGSSRDGLTSVSITINDANGRVLTVITSDYTPGYNTIQVTREMIKGASGVLSYTIEAGEYRATKQMIVVE